MYYAILLICLSAASSCDESTARVSLRLPVDYVSPTACAMAAMTYEASARLKSDDERLVVRCGHRAVTP